MVIQLSFLADGFWSGYMIPYIKKYLEEKKEED